MIIDAKDVLLASTPLYGHAIPLLQFGRKLSRFHRVTFAVPDSLFDGIQKELLPDEEAAYPICFIATKEKEKDSSEGSPDGAVMLRKVFERIFPGMQEFFGKLVRKKPEDSKENSNGNTSDGFEVENGLSFDVVIVDNFLGGPVSVLYRREIPYYLFNTARVWLTQTLLTLDMEVPEETGRKPCHFQHRTSSGKVVEPIFEFNKDILMENCKTMHLADGIIFNSVPEAEETSLTELKTFPPMANMKTFCVCPLDLSIAKTANDVKDDGPMNKWLNGQADASVVYVSFRSIAVPTPEQITEIAKALLQLKAPFLWSLPAAHHVHLPHEIQATMKSTDSQGTDRPFLILPWAPQKQILAHPATGVFVSHCGWNSTLETMACGVPVVAWPMFADRC